MEEEEEEAGRSGEEGESLRMDVLKDKNKKKKLELV